MHNTRLTKGHSKRHNYLHNTVRKHRHWISILRYMISWIVVCIITCSIIWCIWLCIIRCIIEGVLIGTLISIIVCRLNCMILSIICIIMFISRCITIYKNTRTNMRNTMHHNIHDHTRWEPCMYSRTYNHLARAPRLKLKHRTDIICITLPFSLYLCHFDLVAKQWFLLLPLPMSGAVLPRLRLQ